MYPKFRQCLSRVLLHNDNPVSCLKSAYTVFRSNLLFKCRKCRVSIFSGRPLRLAAVEVLEPKERCTMLEMVVLGIESYFPISAIVILFLYIVMITFFSSGGVDFPPMNS